MTNTETRSRQSATRNFAASTANGSDHAPMVITRLSGWIDIGDAKVAAPSWIVPTRKRTRN
jgi:hypothetical protein